MNAWGKVNKAAGKPIVRWTRRLSNHGTNMWQYFLSDTKTFFSKNYGWAAGMGDRNGRWAMVVEKDGTVSYAENESNPGQVTVSQDIYTRECWTLIDLGLWCRRRPLQVVSAGWNPP